MGTNFYAGSDSYNEDQHIGKRSAAGPYCWDCRITLKIGGEAKVHYGGGFYDACPKCGATASKEDITSSSAGRELGFNKSAPMAKRGVASCSSFTWAMKPDALEGYSEVTDEYDRHYTMQEFFQVLEECPIRFYDSIGERFS